jgi:hypothetical protein
MNKKKLYRGAKMKMVIESEEHNDLVFAENRR